MTACVHSKVCTSTSQTQTNAVFGLVCEKRNAFNSPSIINNSTTGCGEKRKEACVSADPTVALIRDHRDTEIAQSVTAVAMTTQLLVNQSR